RVSRTAAGARSVAGTPEVARSANVEARGSAREQNVEPAGRSEAPVSVEAAGQPSEIELLRRARGALHLPPREAFALTEEPRAKSPRGVFAQERDAVAIEALLRAGETSTARSLAERFVREHPSSAHAHRFRESMGLR